MKKLIVLAAALVAVTAAAAQQMNVMTFNMRYDNSEDGLNNWRYRKERVAEVVTSNKIDVVGTQELLKNQFREIQQLLPDYTAVGVARGNGKKKGEFNAVFFRTDRFTLLDSGTFWLSETPEKAGSCGWDGACERIATWAVLREKGGKEFFFINTHLDHRGKVARNEGVTLLCERIAKLSAGREVILTGDFNSSPESEVISHIQQSGLLHYAQPLAAETVGATWSYSDFGEIPEARRPLIDYIFLSDGFSVSRYAILPDQLDGGYVSDHAPVMTVVEFKNAK